MAFGGVATGSIKAHDADIAITEVSTKGEIPRLSAMAANTGISNAALAVLLANSVKKTTNVTMLSSIKSMWLPCKKSPMVLAKNTLVPVALSTALKHRPPPNRSNTLQSVVRSMSFHFTTPKNVSSMIALMATKLSNLDSPPSSALIGPLNIQQNTVKAKISKVMIFAGVHSRASCSTENLCFKSGRTTIKSTAMANGNSRNVSGAASVIHSTKFKLLCAAAMALGGLPTMVAMPPILAQ